MTKLHLGCGSVHLPGYTNVDAVYQPGVDLIENVKFLRSIKAESVDEIYACHVLEHFSRHDYMRVLKRWYKLLKPGGVLKLSVPDFDKIVQYYMQSDQDLPSLIGLLYGGQDYDLNFHYNVFDGKTISKALSTVGFTQQISYDWWREPHAHIHDFSQAYLPHATDYVKTHHKPPEGGHLQMSLNIKALK